MRLLHTSFPGASGVKLRPGPRPSRAQELQHPRSGQRPLHLLTCSRGLHPPSGQNCKPGLSLSRAQAPVPSSFLLPFSFITKATAQGPSARLFPAESSGAKKNGVPLDRLLDPGVGAQQWPNSSFPQTRRQPRYVDMSLLQGSLAFDPAKIKLAETREL